MGARLGGGFVASTAVGEHGVKDEAGVRRVSVWVGIQETRTPRAGMSRRRARPPRAALRTGRCGRLFGAASTASLAFWLVGCMTPAEHRQRANEAAERIITESQELAGTGVERVEVRRPADTLREKLMFEQGLAFASPVSLGTEYLHPIEHWPDQAYLDEPGPDAPLGVVPGEFDAPVRLTLLEALAVAARNSREYQFEKEQVFVAALRLDLAREEFRYQIEGGATGNFLADLSGDEDVTGFRLTPELSFSKRLENGMSFAGAIGVDIVRLLDPSSDSSLALFGDASVSIPLLRGSGRHIVREPLTQAERNAVYAIFEFERFKREFVVDVASQYLGVLQALDQIDNARQNYESLISSTRRLRRLADEGRISEIQVDQAKQNELQARDRWIGAQQSYARALDSFRITLGLPTDSAVELERDEIVRLGEAVREALAEAAPATEVGEPNELEPMGEIAEDATFAIDPDAPFGADAPIELQPPTREGGGPFELDEDLAIRLALANRLDLRRQEGQIVDAQREVVIAADQLRAELTILGSASLGERRSILGAGGDDAFSLAPGEGLYDALITLDLPIDRTEERDFYRLSLIDLERAIRDVQAIEDRIKFEIRERLRTLLTSREGLRIQAAAVTLAERRVESTRLFLETGRAQTRDLLEAQDDLLSAQNALTNALVNYRIAELELQRDMGVLEVDENALWREFDPVDDPALDALEPMEPVAPRFNNPQVGDASRHRSHNMRKARRAAVEDPSPMPPHADTTTVSTDDPQRFVQEGPR